jgi:pyrophosphatase PpaX
VYYDIILVGDFMKKLDTILFDLDGTLINTNEIILESFEHTFSVHFPKIKLDRAKISTFIGPTLQETFSEYTRDPFKIQAMIQTYREYYIENEFDSFEIYPDVIEVLKDLKEKGFNLCIVTSKFKEAAWPSFTHYGLDLIFDEFIALDHVERPKPDRNPVDIALSKFKNHKGAIMIGDNQGDILAGKNANIYSAGVAWALKGSAHLMEVSPNFMLSTMIDIYRIIRIIEEE